jgi:hypothetical protein
MNDLCELMRAPTSYVALHPRPLGLWSVVLVLPTAAGRPIQTTLYSLLSREAATEAGRDVASRIGKPFKLGGAGNV